MKRSDVLTSPRLAGYVKRYHSWPTITEQTVADHTFHVLRIYAYLFGWPDADVTEMIMKHDLPELVTGDPPFPIKMQNPELKVVYDKLDTKALLDMDMEISCSVDLVTKARIKIADLLEMHEFGLFELTLGNRFAGPVIEDTIINALLVAEKSGDTYAVRKWMDRTTEKWRMV